MASLWTAGRQWLGGLRGVVVGVRAVCEMMDVVGRKCGLRSR